MPEKILLKAWISLNRPYGVARIVNVSMLTSKVLPEVNVSVSVVLIATFGVMQYPFLSQSYFVV